MYSDQQPTFAVRKRSSFEIFRTVIGRLSLYLSFVALGLCTYIGLYQVITWTISKAQPISTGAGVCIVSTFMAVVTLILAWRSYTTWKSCRLWLFTAVFFMGTAVQAFLTRGGA